MKLPDAVLANGGGLNKLAYYQKASGDSSKRVEQRKSDPYAQQAVDSGTKSLPAFSSSKITGSAASEDKIYQRLAQLQAVVNKPVNTAPPSRSYNDQSYSKSVSTAKPAEDPELKQMSGLLEKVLDIQHPERLKEKTDQKPVADKQFSAIPAVVDGNQKVTDGTVVKIKLLDTVTINGQLIPKGTLLYGAASLYNQRLIMTIKNIGLGNTILPVDLTVFDKKDVLEGISVPEAMTGDAVKNGADNGLQSMQLMSLDASMGAQAAAAGINTAKGLFSKKIKRVKGKIKDGHLLLLRDNKKMNQLINKK
jgi:hypothetical protein